MPNSIYELLGVHEGTGSVGSKLQELHGIGQQQDIQEDPGEGSVLIVESFSTADCLIAMITSK